MVPTCGSKGEISDLPELTLDRLANEGICKGKGKVGSSQLQLSLTFVIDEKTYYPFFYQNTDLKVASLNSPIVDSSQQS